MNNATVRRGILRTAMLCFTAALAAVCGALIADQLGQGVIAERIVSADAYVPMLMLLFVADHLRRRPPAP